MITFEKCNPKERATCKSEEEIAEWIKGKYLITIENTWSFRQSKYDEQKLTAESKFYWNLLASQVRGEQGRMITVTNIEF